MRVPLATPMLLLATAAFAEDTARLDGLAACRSSAEAVELRFSYTGSVCEETEPAVVAVEGRSARVTVQRRGSAEICTLQALEIDVAQTIDVPPDVAVLEVMLVGPRGQPSATGETAIEAQCTEA